MFHFSNSYHIRSFPLLSLVLFLFWYFYLTFILASSSLFSVYASGCMLMVCELRKHPPTFYSLSLYAHASLSLHEIYSHIFHWFNRNMVELLFCQQKKINILYGWKHWRRANSYSLNVLQKGYHMWHKRYVIRLKVERDLKKRWIWMQNIVISLQNHG